MQGDHVTSATVGQWPPTAVEANPTEWCEINEEHYWYFLEVLPPIDYAGGFAVSEPWTHTAEGLPTYLCISTVRGKHYARHATIGDAVRLTRELRDELTRSSLVSDAAEAVELFGDDELERFTDEQRLG